MKKCPYCLSEIHEATIVCPNCNSDLMVTVPFRVVSKLDTREKANQRSRLVAGVILGFFMMLLVAALVTVLFLLWNSY